MFTGTGKRTLASLQPRAKFRCLTVLKKITHLLVMRKCFTNVLLLSTALCTGGAQFARELLPVSRFSLEAGSKIVYQVVSIATGVASSTATSLVAGRECS